MLSLDISVHCAKVTGCLAQQGADISAWDNNPKWHCSQFKVLSSQDESNGQRQTEPRYLSGCACLCGVYVCVRACVRANEPINEPITNQGVNE